MDDNRSINKGTTPVLTTHSSVCSFCTLCIVQITFDYSFAGLQHRAAHRALISLSTVLPNGMISMAPVSVQNQKQHEASKGKAGGVSS